MAAKNGALQPGVRIGTVQATWVMLKNVLMSGSFVASFFLILVVLLYAKDVPGNFAVKTFIFPISFNNGMSLVAFAAGVCATAYYAQEITSKYLYYELSRISKKQYLIARFLSCSLATGLAMLVAFGVFALFCIVEAQGRIAPPIDDLLSSFLFQSSLIVDGHHFLWFASILVIQFFFGFLLGGTGVAFTAFIPNKFIGYTSPFLFMFFWMQLCSLLSLPVWLNPLNLSKCLADTGDTAMTFGIYCLVFILFSLAFFLLFYFRASKEVKGNE